MSFTANRPQPTQLFTETKTGFLNGLDPVRDWLNSLEIRNPTLCRIICAVIPVQCPFERSIYFLGRKIAHIPPLCKLNPFYDELMSLRFRALCYLTDEWGEDSCCDRV